MNSALAKGVAERAVKTFAQAFIATLGITATATYTGEQALALPWETALVTSAVATLLSVVTSLLNPSFTAGSSTSADLPLDDIVEGSVVPDTDPMAGSGDVTTEDVDQTVAAAAADYTPEHAEGASVVPDGEGVATNQS